MSLHYAPPEKKVVYDNLVISVSNLDKFREILTSNHIESTEIKDVPNVLSFLTVKDSDGNKITLLADPRVKSE